MNQKALHQFPKRRITPQRVTVTFRLPEDLVVQIDEHLAKRRIPLSRNNWLLEAAIEKLQRKNGGRRNGT